MNQLTGQPTEHKLIRQIRDKYMQNTTSHLILTIFPQYLYCIWRNTGCFQYKTIEEPLSLIRPL